MPAGKPRTASAAHAGLQNLLTYLLRLELEGFLKHFVTTFSKVTTDSVRIIRIIGMLENNSSSSATFLFIMIIPLD